HRLEGRPDLPARRARRSHSRALRAALVALAERRPAARRAGARDRTRSATRLLARAEAPRLRPRCARVRARIPAPPGRPVADAERVPPGRAGDATPALRVLVPRRGPARAVRGLRGAGLRLQGGDPARRRRLRGLVRALA